MKKVLVVLLCLATSAAMAAPLSVANPPPGAIPKYWSEAVARAAWIRKTLEASGTTKGACIEAVALDILGAMDVEWSKDAKGRGPGTRRKVVAGKEDAFSKALKENANERCKDDDNYPGGDGVALQATVRALLHFAEDNVEGWTTAGVDRFAERLREAAEAVVGMPAMLPAVLRRATTAPAAIPVPILPPSLFMKTEVDSL